MDIASLTDNITFIITSIGGYSVVVVGLSSWLGKIWANRILEREKKVINADLQKYNSELQKDINKSKAEIEALLALQREKNVLTYREKIEIYRRTVTPIIDFIASIYQSSIKNKPLDEDTINSFTHQRLKVYSDLTLFADLKVMSAYDELVDYISGWVEMYVKQKQKADGPIPLNWNKLRALSLDLFNSMRVDVGIAKGDIMYTGKR